MNSPPQTRVFIVDDSATSRALLRKVLATDPKIVLVGEASSGEEALRRIPRFKPDVVLMDIVMGGMSGLTATAHLMETQPLPIVLVSELVSTRADMNFKGLQHGALDVLRKPTLAELAEPRRMSQFCKRVRSLAEIPMVTRPKKRTHTPPPLTRTLPRPIHRVKALPAGGGLVCIGASTGGPTAVSTVLRGLPRPLTVPVVIVLHVAQGFAAGLAKWLGDVTDCDVQLAVDGERLCPGRVYLAPDLVHLELRGNILTTSERPPIQGVRPSIDHFFRSVSDNPIAVHTVAVLLTGMGRDGADGLLALRKSGAVTIAQDEATSVVWGMPRAAIEIDGASDVLPVELIGAAVRTGLFGG